MSLSDTDQMSEYKLGLNVYVSGAFRLAMYGRKNTLQRGDLGLIILNHYNCFQDGNIRYISHPRYSYCDSRYSQSTGPDSVAGRP